MNLTQRASMLKTLFTHEKSVVLEDAPVEIRSYPFVQALGEREIDDLQAGMPAGEFCPTPDNGIEENKRFPYAVFLHGKAGGARGAIILLHGLNERSWDKYLPWAERLATTTGKAVILFPLAFHMNRTPARWRDPRALLPWVSRRGSEAGNATFANVAISTRLAASPLRFYASGRESVLNLWQLVAEIRGGRHPLFKEGATVDLFAYSIGALLAQVLLLADPGGLTGDTRLFMFCGGALFSYMDGSARDIVDQAAYARVREFYLDDFPRAFRLDEDPIVKAFKAMIVPGGAGGYREAAFERAGQRLRAVTLRRDSVIPTRGVARALGERLAASALEEWDFPFPYSHQHPFPAAPGVEPGLLQRSFDALFDRAAGFLG
ncbi:MAG: DUF6051 family protein [Odoribacteraceae bacterium]|jgi:hypothetical protein|nr:DUF6051 family protein [Odoribacteraceae bacterium]